jgi:PAS domain S-box-containing protein
MKQRAWIIAVFSVCLLAAVAALLPFAAGAETTGNRSPLTLTADISVYPLGRHMDLLEDSTGRLTIDEVAAPALADRFARSAVDVPALGLTRSVYWARIGLTNRVAGGGDWYLVYRQAMVDRVTVHLPQPGGAWATMQGGILVPDRSKRLEHRYAVFPLHVPVGEIMTFYVRVENRDALEIPLVLQTVESLYASDRSEQLLFGVLFGILLTVCVYLFFIWQVMRELSQAWLILLQISLAFYIASVTGFLAEYLWSNLAWWNGFSVQLGILGVIVSGLCFTRSFLALDRHMPRLSRLLLGLAVLFTALIGLAAVDLHRINVVLPYGGILVAVLFLYAGAGTAHRKREGGAVFLAAFSALVLGGLSRSLVDLAILPSTVVTENFFHIGSAISSIIFAIGIAGQFKARQEEKERKLLLSNERFTLASQWATAGLYDWDLGNNTIYYSRRMAELYGEPPSDTRDYHSYWLNLIHPADAASSDAAFRAFLRSPSTTLVLEYRLQCPDGVTRWVTTTGAAVRDPATNRVIRLAGSTADITEKKQAEESLRASESLKAAVIASSLDCIITSDTEGRIIEFNPAAELIFGYSREAVIGRPIADIIVPSHLRGFHTDGIDRFFTTHEPDLLGRRVEIEAMRADGTVFPIELAVSAVRAGDQTVFTAFVRDITERRQAEAALRDSQRDLAEKSRFLEAVLDTIEQGINVVDADLNIRLANQRFLEMYDLPPELARPGAALADMLRQRIARGEYPPGDPDAILTEHLAAFCSAPMTHREETRPDGRVIDLWRRPMEGGGAVTTYSDITRLKQAEREAKASEQRFRGILEAHPVPVIITRLEDGAVLYGSPRAAEMFGVSGYPAEPLAAMDFYPNPNDRLRLLAALHQSGSIDRTEVRFRRRDGSIFPAALSSRLIEYEGRPAAVTGLYDLTASKQAEEEIARQREALNQSEKLAALGSLLAGVAHELNNPLSVVVGQSVLLEETAPDSRTAERARKIHLAADRCARIVKTFLSLARRRPPERSEVDLKDIVEAALDLVAYALQADGIVIRLDLAADLPRLWADADQINQVVTNLVVNARQAMQERPSPRRLTITTRRDGAAGSVRLAVADNGPGVPSDIRRRIFEPFFTTKPVGVGTGVGLSMCHNIIDAHGGRIELEETPGGGATFVIHLPVPAGAAPAPSREIPAPIPASTGPRRLLIVDDEPDIALMLAEILEPEGHIIDIAENGRDALERIAGQAYDLIVSDLRMPELDGPGLYRTLQRDRPDLAGRIVFVTGDTLANNVRRFLDETGAPVLEKPYGPADIRRLVACALADSGPCLRHPTASAQAASAQAEKGQDGQHDDDDTDDHENIIAHGDPPAFENDPG